MSIEDPPLPPPLSFMERFKTKISKISKEGLLEVFSKQDDLNYAQIQNPLKASSKMGSAKSTTRKKIRVGNDSLPKIEKL